MNTSIQQETLESIREKIRQGEPLSISEKLVLIKSIPKALMVAVGAALVVPSLVLDFKLKAEGHLADAHHFLGLNAPTAYWLCATVLVGLISLHSVYSIFGLLFPQRKWSSPVIRLLICAFIEIAWLAIEPSQVIHQHSGWFEIALVGFLVLVIVFCNAVYFGSVIAEGEIRTDAKVWENSHAVRCQQYEATIADLRGQLVDKQADIDRLRDWYVPLQKMVDDCPAGPNGSSVLVVERRKAGPGAYRHEISIRPSDLARTGCEEMAPVALSDPLLDCPTRIAREPSPAADTPTSENSAPSAPLSVSAPDSDDNTSSAPEPTCDAYAAGPAGPDAEHSSPTNMNGSPGTGVKSLRARETSA